MNNTQTEDSKNTNGSQNMFLGLHYDLEPDYTKSRPEIDPAKAQIMRDRLTLLYGEEASGDAYKELERIIAVHQAYTPPEVYAAEAKVDPTQRFTERDVVLITYGDLIVAEDKRPLAALADFTERMFRGLITTLHILPFFPYSSDRGFSVVEYGQVDPELGSWRDISELKNSFKLMFDGVINHCSAQCKWFRRFLGGDPRYKDFFFVYDSPDAIAPEHLEKIFRPRTSDILTKFETLEGSKYVWTTFSADQVDLNFKNPLVLLKIFRILLGYVRHGADLIRLDAITYLWRELGTSCIHLEQTHEVVKLFRDVLDVACPHVALITETNVPHDENITYFGDGADEAQMVYNFALPPLVLHTCLTGDSTVLSRWAKELIAPSDTTSFFNFLDSHDGIGLMGARGYLNDDEITNLCDTVKDRGGFISMKDNGDGTQSPYEMNTTWYSAVNPSKSDEDETLQMHRFLASRAIALVLKGVPGIYMLSMFASQNDLDAVAKDNVYRSINRSALYEDKVCDMLLDRNSQERRITARYLDMIEVRVAEPAFHPNAEQEIVDLGPDVFAIKRIPLDGSSPIFCIINVTDQELSLKIPRDKIGIPGDKFSELVKGTFVKAESDTWELDLRPYRVRWYKQA